jgi:hypothetical protein
MLIPRATESASIYRAVEVFDINIHHSLHQCILAVCRAAAYNNIHHYIRALVASIPYSGETLASIT